jgi:hypothetical protein
MTTTHTPGRRPSGRPLKSPLAVDSGGPAMRPAAAETAGQALPGRGVSLSSRGLTLAEFEDYLRTINNRDGRPYEEKAIDAYLTPARNLDKWLAARGVEDDFTAADTALLNKYFPEYYLERGQGPASLS